MAKGVTARRVGHAAFRVVRWLLVMLRNGRLPAGAGAVALGVALAYLVTDPAYTVRRVVVTGVVALPGTGLAESSGALGQGIFSIDPDAVAARVATQPSVRRVEVWTETPGTLVIAVQERGGALLWETEGASYLLDGSGMVLGQVAAGTAPSLPVVRALPGNPSPIVGERVDDGLVRTALSLNERLPSEVGLTQGNLVVDPLLGVIVQTPEWRAVVGTDDRLGSKLAVLKAMLREPQWSDLDVRDPDRAVFTRKVTPTAQPSAAPTRRP